MIMHRNYIKLKQTNFILLVQHILICDIFQKFFLPWMKIINNIHHDSDFYLYNDVKNISKYKGELIFFLFLFFFLLEPPCAIVDLIVKCLTDPV